MKILLIRQFNPFFESGASSNRFRGLIDGLRKCGNTVDVAVVKGFTKRNEASISEVGTKYLSHANHYSYWQTRMNNYIFDRLHAISAARRFSKLDYNSYDIIWITTDMMVLDLYAKFCGKIKAKTLIELNEFIDFYLNVNYNILQVRKARKASELFKEVVGKIDLFAVMTNTLIDYYRKMADKNARFLHLPMTVDLNRFREVDSNNEFEIPYIGFCGSMDKTKDGVDILIKAFMKIAHKYPDVKLLMAGFYTYDTPDILKIISDNKMEERIKYIGSMDRAKIPSFISNAITLALSRPDSHQAQGGFPTKLGEYLATGKPVCVTKVGEIPEYLEDNVSAFMANPGDVDSFADALDRALGNPNLAITVGQAGKCIAETIFNSDIQAKRLSDFLKINLL